VDSSEIAIQNKTVHVDMRDLSKCISSYVLLCLKNICCYFEHNFRKSKRNVLAAKPLDKISFDPKTLISPDLDSRYVFLEEGIVLDFCSFIFLLFHETGSLVYKEFSWVLFDIK